MLISDTKQIILSLKRVRDEKGLSIDKILSLMEDKDPNNMVSRTTVARVFADGSEDSPTAFRYDTTLKPIANALLDADEDEDSVDKLAYKSILKYKSDLLADFEHQNRELKEELRTIKETERDKYTKRLEKETTHFSNSMAFITKQIQLKDDRIDTLLKMNNELMATNNKLLQQLMEK